MKRRTHSAPIPKPATIREWVDVSALYPVVDQSTQQILEAVGGLKSSQYREITMFPAQFAGVKPQISREAMQQLLDNGTLTLRNYVVTPRGERTARPIALFCATHDLTAPGKPVVAEARSR